MVAFETSDTSANIGYCAPKASELARQAVRGLRIQRCLAVAIHVAQRHENLQRLVFRRLAAQPEQRLDDVVGVLPAGRVLAELGVVLAAAGRMFDEQSAPYFQASGDVRLAVRIQAQPRGQQHHVGVGAEHRAGRPGLVTFPRMAE